MAKGSSSMLGWIVMWRGPSFLRPLKGWVGPNSLHAAMSAGILISARVSSMRLNSAELMSLTLGMEVACMVKAKSWVWN